jgi:hypothetical protein
MTNEDRRAKLVTKLLQQKTVVTPGYTCGKTESGKDRKEAWVNASPNGFVFFVRYRHSELELAPGLKGISVASVADIPAVIDHIIQVVNTGYFDSQKEKISHNLANKIKGGKSGKLPQAA